MVIGNKLKSILSEKRESGKKIPVGGSMRDSSLLETLPCL